MENKRVRINNSETLRKTSVQRIKVANSDETKSFDVSHVTEEEIKNEILNLSSKKSTKKDNFPAKVLKDSINVYSKELTAIINSYLEKGLFPNKKEEDLNKENYRPASILNAEGF